MLQPREGRKRSMICVTDEDFRQLSIDQTSRQNKRRQFNSPFISQTSCVVCMDTGLQLVQLGSCGHAVCRGCMGSALLHAFKLQQLPLRCPLPHCKARLQLQPAVQLLEQQVPGSSAMAAKVLLAAAADMALIPDHLCCPCPYTDCQVPLELPDDPLPGVPLDCPSCQRPICSTCRSKWHSGLACCQYQALLGSRHGSHLPRQPQPQAQPQQQPARAPSGTTTSSTAGPVAATTAAAAVGGSQTRLQAQRWQGQRPGGCEPCVCPASPHQQPQSHHQQCCSSSQRGACDGGGEAMIWSPAKVA